MIAEVPRSTSLLDFCRRLGVKPGMGTYQSLRTHITRLGLDSAHLRMTPHGRGLRLHRSWSDADLEQAVESNFSVAAVLRALGYTPNGGMYRYITAHIRRLGLDTSHFQGQAWARGLRLQRRPVTPLDDLLMDGTYVNGGKLRQRLIGAGLKEDRCEDCGLTSWRGRPLRLELHHANGVHTDNRLENLRILCPNCHAVDEAVLRILRRRIPIGRETAPRTPSVRVRIPPPALLSIGEFCVA